MKRFAEQRWIRVARGMSKDGVKLSDEIPIKLAKLDTAVKTYLNVKNLQRTFNDTSRYDGNFEKVYRKEDV